MRENPAASVFLLEMEKAIWLRSLVMVCAMFTRGVHCYRHADTEPEVVLKVLGTSFSGAFLLLCRSM